MDGLDASLSLTSVLVLLVLMRGLGVEASLAVVAAGLAPLLLRRGLSGLPPHLQRMPLGAAAVFSTVFLVGGITLFGLLTCQASSQLFDQPARPLAPAFALAGLPLLALPGVVLLVAGLLLGRHASGERGC